MWHNVSDAGTMQKIPSPHRIWLGRSRELGELEAGLDELDAGRGSLFLVAGEPGIGKTRLAEEVGRAASARGVSVHWGRAWEAGGAPSYWPFIQALRTMSSETAVLDALVTPSPTPVERFQMFETIDAFLRSAARTPRLLVLDDLHAADLSSLQLLHFIVRDLRSRPLMVIATYRDGEVRLSPELAPLIARIAREGCVLSLRPLDRDDVAEFVARATGRAPTGDRVDELVRKTEGNPLFLRELLQLHGAEAWRSETIREVVRARLALLPRESRALLEAAAVLGREFAAAPLAAVAGMAEPEARALIEPAANAGIVEGLENPPRWRFTHVLLREGLYGAAPARRRAALHLAAATELKKRLGGLSPTELAHHLFHAVPEVSPSEAARAVVEAADHAMSLLAFEDALALYERAESQLDGTQGEERLLFDAVLGAGNALMRMAEVDRGKRACGRAADLARQLGDGERFARAVLAGGYEHAPWVRDAAGLAGLEEALSILPPGDGALRARCMAQLAGDRDPEPDPEPLMQLARDAVAMARRTGDPDALLSTLSAASFALAVYPDPAERSLLFEETLRLALAAGDKRVALRAHGFLVGASLDLGDPEGARAHVVAVESLVQDFPHGRFSWLLLFIRAIEELLQGRFEEAHEIYAEARASLNEDEARGALMAGSSLSVACVTERYDDVAGIEAETRAAFASLGYPFGGLIGEMLIAQLYGRAGARERAAAQLATCAADPLFESIREPLWLAMLTDACHLTSDAALADRLYTMLLPRAHRFALMGPITACVDLPYARHLGLLAETLGRIDDAVAHLEDAEARASRAKMRAHLARLWLELARALVARGGSGDRDRAASLAGRALALATELGQTGLLPGIAALTGDREITAPPAAGIHPPSFSMRREGDYWSVESEGRTVRLRDRRGLSLLSRLLDRPGQELHVLQLTSSGSEPSDAGDAGPALDDAAIQSYRRRLLELREELEEAERFADSGRAEKARAEMDFLTEELARAVGLGGRARRVGSAAERARTTVQKRLREAIRRIEAELPELGRHLDQTVRTGLFCGYFPDGRR